VNRVPRLDDAEIAQQKVIDDSGVIAVISKLAKQHRESIDAFRYMKN